MILSKRSNARPMLAALLSASILLQPLYGLRAHAQDRNDEDSPQEEVFPEGSPADLAGRAAELISEEGAAARLPLTPAQRNVFYLLNQTVVERKTGEEVDITKLDLSRAQMNIPNGLIERSLEVAIKGDGIELSYPKSRYIHRITFNKGQAAKSVTLDNEYANILMQNGELLVIDIISLRKLMFQCSIPVFTVGRVFENVSAIDPSTEIKIIQRRNPSLDASRSAQEAVLDRQEITQRRILALADRRLIGDLEANLARIQYIPLSQRLMSEIEYLSSGDIAVIQGTPGVDQHIMKVVPRARIAQDVADQNGGFQAMLALASDHTEDALKEMEGLTQEGVDLLQEIVSDDRNVQDYFASGLAEAVAKIPQANANAILAHAAEVVRQDQNLNSRDRFTPQEWYNDAEYFTRTIELAKEKIVDGRQFPRWFNRLTFKISERWKKLYEPDSVQRLTKIMGCTAIVCTGAVLDYAVNKGQAIGAALDVMSGSFHWMLSGFPVLIDEGYRPTLMLSMLTQAAIPALIFGAAMLAAPFTQFKWASLPSTFGIRSFARLFQISPLRVFADITGQRSAFHALKHGHLAAPVGPLNNDQRVLSEEAITRNVRAQKLKNSMATVIALCVVASRENVDPGELFVSSKGLDPNSGKGLVEAMEVSEEISRRMHEMSTRQIEEFLAKHEQTLLSEISEYRKAATKITLPKARESWWRSWSEYVRTRVKTAILKKVGNYSEETYENLSNATPDEFTTRLITRGYVIDYLISLGTAGTSGAWADLSKPELLHGQADAWLWTNPQAVSENGQQTLIHMMRGAANTYMVFSAAASSVNVVHRPAELVDHQERQVPGMKPLFREAWEFTKSMFDFRNVQHGETIGRVTYTGRIKLFQSTVAIGLLPRMALGGQGFEQALLGQFMFMACAMWSFGWPWMPIQGAQNVHETAIEENYKTFRNMQVLLSQAVRLNDETAALEANKAMLAFYENADLRVFDIPEQYAEESETVFSERLLNYSYENHPIAHRHSNLIANIATTAGAVATTILATYLYTSTFSGNIHWWGANLTDWNLFTHIPEGDGIFSLMGKASVFTTIAWGGQRFFNWMWDSARLNVPYFFNPKNAVERQALVDRQQAAREKFKDFGPVRVTLKTGEKVKQLFQPSCSMVFGK